MSGCKFCGHAGNGPAGGPDSGLLSAVRWTDFSTSATASKIGILDKPDFDFVNLGLLFPQDDTAERIYIIAQMPHEKKLGSPLRLHVHFKQSQVALPIFKCDYKFYNNGEAIPGSFTTISTNDGAGPLFTYPGSGDIIQLLPFQDIPAPIDEKISANLDLIIYRDDNIIVGDVLLKYTDFHYEKDSQGSRLEYSK